LEKADATWKYPTLSEAWQTTLAPTLTSRLMTESMDGLTLSPQNAASRIMWSRLQARHPAESLA